MTPSTVPPPRPAMAIFFIVSTMTAVAIGVSFGEGKRWDAACRRRGGPMAACAATALRCVLMPTYERKPRVPRMIKTQLGGARSVWRGRDRRTNPPRVGGVTRLAVRASAAGMNIGMTAGCTADRCLAGKAGLAALSCVADLARTIGKACVAGCKCESDTCMLKRRDAAQFLPAAQIRLCPAMLTMAATAAPLLRQGPPMQSPCSRLLVGDTTMACDTLRSRG